MRPQTWRAKIYRDDNGNWRTMIHARGWTTRYRQHFSWRDAVDYAHQEIGRLRAFVEKGA
jgi:hypothetical protein